MPTGPDESAGGLQLPAGMNAGCGDAARTDPTDLRPNRVVARCAPGAPVADPLDQPVTVRVAVRDPGEDQAALLLADRFGELAAEGITAELVEVAGPAEAYAQLAEGTVDAVAGDLHGRFLDMVVAGDGARLVLGSSVPSAASDLDVPQVGLWIATPALSQTGRWRDLEHRAVAVAEGISGATAYPLMNAFLQDELSLNDVELVLTGGEDAARRLLSGGVVAAWLEPPHWQHVMDEPGFELAVTRPPEPLGGLVLHQRLLDTERDRDVGQALVRALIRTINTHLTGDYREDGEVVAALAEAIGWDEETLRAAPPQVFDWEIRAGTIERLQEALLPLGGVTFEELHDEEVFLDRSLYEEAVRSER